MQKRKARSYHKNIRNEMTKEQVQSSSKIIAERILASIEFQGAEAILAYYPLGNEVSLLPVIEYCLEHGKKIAFPRVTRKETSDSKEINIPQMDFFEISNLSQLSEGTFHVMEPTEDCRPVNWQSDWTESKTLVLTPGVAFDRAGARVGYGKGYYDHFFTKHPGCTRMGVAYENQVEDVIETDEQDVAMNYLVTEENMLELSQKAEN